MHRFVLKGREVPGRALVSSMDFVLILGVHPQMSIEVVLSVETLITIGPGAYEWPLASMRLHVAFEMIIIVETFMTVRIDTDIGLKA